MEALLKDFLALWLTEVRKAPVKWAILGKWVRLSLFMILKEKLSNRKSVHFALRPLPLLPSQNPHGFHRPFFFRFLWIIPQALCIYLNNLPFTFLHLSLNFHLDLTCPGMNIFYLFITSSVPPAAADVDVKPRTRTREGRLNRNATIRRECTGDDGDDDDGYTDSVAKQRQHFWAATFFFSRVRHL